jgi:hypothetical protein
VTGNSRPSRDWPLCARYWIPNLRIISPEGLQVELKKGLAEYWGARRLETINTSKSNFNLENRIDKDTKNK